MKIGLLISSLLLVAVVAGGCARQKSKETVELDQIISSENRHHGLIHYQQRTRFKQEKTRKYCEQAHILLEKGKVSEARALYRQALEIEPENAMALTQLGNLAFRESQYDEAIRYFNRSHILTDTVHLNAGVFLGRSYYLNGEYEKCVIISKYTLENTTDEKSYYLSYYNMAKALIKEGKCDAASESFSKAKPIMYKFSNFQNRILALEHELQSCMKKEV